MAGLNREAAVLPKSSLYNGRMADLERSLFLLAGSFAICRLDKNAAVPDWAKPEELFSVTRTADELSIVCSQEDIPQGTDCETGWRCLKVESPFEFDLTGAIASIAAPLAEADVPLFVVATQDSDYLMVKEIDLERTILILSQAGHQVDRRQR